VIVHLFCYFYIYYARLSLSVWVIIPLYWTKSLLKKQRSWLIMIFLPLPIDFSELSFRMDHHLASFS